MGALIVQEVVRELLDKGLSGAKVLLRAGSRWAGQGPGGGGAQAHCLEDASVLRAAVVREALGLGT